jgi:DNA-binding phage protein
MRSPESSCAFSVGGRQSGDVKDVGGTSKPKLDTIQKIVNSLGVKLVAEPIRKSVRSAT